MSGKFKRTVYLIADGLLYLLSVAEALLLLFWKAMLEGGIAKPAAPEFVCVAVLLLLIFLKIPVLLHETGHLLFGLAAGMKPVSFSVGMFTAANGKLSFSRERTEGKTTMLPRRFKHVRGGIIAYTVGGSALNFIVAAALIPPSIFLPYSPVLVSLGFLGIFSLYEGIRALIPAELRTGKTDGAVLKGLLAHSPEEEVLLRVSAAQAILGGAGFSEIKRELLFDVPVVREDLPAYHALLLLRAQYLFNEEDMDGAKAELFRLAGLNDYYGEELTEEVRRYLAVFSGGFEKKPSPLKGINLLEEKLAAEK